LSLHLLLATKETFKKSVEKIISLFNLEQCLSSLSFGKIKEEDQPKFIQSIKETCKKLKKKENAEQKVNFLKKNENFLLICYFKTNSC